MKKAPVTSTNLRGDINRSWGLTVLKTAYRDRYPHVTADVISKNARKVEERMAQKASSNDHYDASILKAYNTITMHGTTATNRNSSSTEGCLGPNVRRTQRCPSRTSIAVESVGKGASIRNNRDAEIVKRVESPTPIKKAAREVTASSKATKIIVEDGLHDGKLDFFSERLDPSDVIMLVPFILEAGLQVIGEINTVEQTQSISESQKTSICFLGKENMFRALYLANRDKDFDKAPTNKTQELSANDQEEIVGRTSRLRKEYLKDIRTIYAKLGERFDTPDCDKNTILSLSNSLKKLEEIEDRTYTMSRRTFHILNYVENVFESAIERYSSLLSVEFLPYEVLKASKGEHGNGWARPSSAMSHANRTYLREGRKFQNGDIGERKGSRTTDSSKQGDNDDFNRYPTHCDEATDNDEGINHSKLRLKYGDNIKMLIPLIHAELGNLSDAKEIREQICFMTAFLNLDNVTDKKLVQRAENIFQGIYERFRHLLRGESSRAQIAEERSLLERDAQKFDAHVRSPLTRPTKMTGHGLKRNQTVEEDMRYECVSEECDEDSEKRKDKDPDGTNEHRTEKLRMKWDGNYNDADSEIKDGQTKIANELKSVDDTLDEVEENESDEIGDGSDDVVKVSIEDGNENGETGCETRGDEHKKKLSPLEELKGLQKEKCAKAISKEHAVAKYEAKIGEQTTEMCTPRRSQRTSVIAVRPRKSSFADKTSKNCTNRTPHISKNSKGDSNTARIRTSERVLRPRKTPKKE